MKSIRLCLTLLLLPLFALPAQAVEVQKVVSPGGIEAWLVEDHSNPIISMDFAFRGGAALDPVGKEGLANMISSLLDEGAGDLDSEAFQALLTNNAITLRFSAGGDNFSGVLRTLTETKDLAFDLLHKAITEPRFDDDAVERMRAQIFTILRDDAENPRSIARRTMAEAFFPDHPYGRPVDGTMESVAALTVEDFKGFVDQRLARNNLKIGIVGDITAEDLATLLDRTFLALPQEAGSWALPWQAPDADGELLIVEKDIPQSVLRFGHHGPKRKDPDFYAAYVMNHILGGGTNSRLYAEVRQKRGLVYGVGSFLSPRRDTALILGSAATANERVAETIAVIQDEWQRMAESGPNEEELEEAKLFLTGSYALRQSSTGSIAGMLLGIQLTGLDENYINERNSLIEAVTIEDAKRVAAKWLDPKALSFIVVGTPQGVTEVKQDGS